MFSSHRPARILFAFVLVFALLLTTLVIAGSGDEKAAKLAWPMIKNGALLVDVRSTEEFEEGHLEGAINIAWDNYDALITAIGEDKQRAVVFYCRSGNRAGKSIVELGAKGYTNIHNATGLKELKATKP